MFNKQKFILDAAVAGVKPEEVDFRFSAFEAMSLSFQGKKAEAAEKLKESQKYYDELKLKEKISAPKLTLGQRIKKLFKI